MSAHEFMNMARVRAEQAEARAAKAEAERDALAELLYEANEREKALEDRFERTRPVMSAAFAWDRLIAWEANPDQVAMAVVRLRAAISSYRAEDEA